MNDRENIFDEYEMSRDAFKGEDLGDVNSNHKDTNKQASKFLDNVNNVEDLLRDYYIGRILINVVIRHLMIYSFYFDKCTGTGINSLLVIILSRIWSRS